jgi:hypothetical protein
MFKFRFEETLSNHQQFFKVYDSGDNAIAYIQYRNDNSTIRTWCFTGSSASAETTETFGIDESVWIKFRTNKAAGVDGQQACVAIYDSGWGDWVCSSDGDNTGDIDYIYFVNAENDDATDYYYYDAVQVYVGTSDPFTGAPE